MRKGSAVLILALAMIAAASLPAAAAAETTKFKRQATVMGKFTVTDKRVKMNFELSTKKQVDGTARLRCRISGGEEPESVCRLKSRFPGKGRISARINTRTAQENDPMRITGGTGRFHGARGEIGFKEHGQRRVTLIYKLK